jgi:hypothetical protein
MFARCIDAPLDTMTGNELGEPESAPDHPDGTYDAHAVRIDLIGRARDPVAPGGPHIPYHREHLHVLLLRAFTDEARDKVRLHR